MLALLIGAWAAMWAVRAGHARASGAASTPVAAFLAAMLAVAMLTAQAEAPLGVSRWVGAAPAERAAVAAEALSIVVRPLIAAGVGALLLVAGLGIGANLGQHPAPAPTAPGRWSTWLDRGVVGAIVAAGLVDLWLWFVLRRGLAAVTAGTERFSAGLPRMQLQVALGAATNAVLLALALGVAAGALRGWLRQRRTASTPATDAGTPAGA